MIESFREDWLREFFEEDKPCGKIPPGFRGRLFRKLQMMDDAQTEQDLQVPPGNRFEKLKGNLGGWCSIRVSQQWRLIFQWSDGEVRSVYLDNHSYR